jgi:sugar lactone lactonase YvrE
MGYSGDGASALKATMNIPAAVAVDTNNNVYFSDSLNHCVRKINSAGIISTVAGNGTEGFSGDGGKATDAQLDQPQGIALDGHGNLFIADYGNQRIRKVASDGTITTVAGSKKGFIGDNGPAPNAAFHDPLGVAADPLGNLYVADAENSRIRKISFDGVVTTIAGIDTAGFSGDGGPATAAEMDRPTDVAVDASGDLFIADSGNNRIRKITPDGIISTVAGSGDPLTFSGGFSGDKGPATEATLSVPTDVTVDSAGNVYFTDTFNSRIRKIDTGGIITTLVGSGIAGFSGERNVATEAALNEPIGVEIDGDGNLYIADSENQRIRKAFNIAAGGLLAGQPFPQPQAGDVNRDGKINVLDAVLVLRAVAKLEILSAPQLTAADFNGDGKLNVLDAVALLRKIAGFTN